MKGATALSANNTIRPMMSNINTNGASHHFLVAMMN